MPNLLVNKTDTFTNNSNNSISKDFFEQQLHGDSFHPYVILHFICFLKPADPGCQHGVQQEWGGARGDNKEPLSAGKSEAAEDRTWGHVNTVTLIFSPSHVIC